MAYIMICYDGCGLPFSHHTQALKVIRERSYDEPLELPKLAYYANGYPILAGKTHPALQSALPAHVTVFLRSHVAAECAKAS